MNDLEQKMGDFFLNKMPPLPSNVKETAARVVPWIIIVFGVLGMLAWVSSIRFFIGVSGLVSQISGHYSPDIFTMLSLVIAPVIQIFAIYGGYLMLSRQYRGWRIVLYALLIGLIPSVLSFNIIGIIINLAFAYLLFQIKQYYPQNTAS